MVYDGAQKWRRQLRRGKEVESDEERKEEEARYQVMTLRARLRSLIQNERDKIYENGAGLKLGSHSIFILS